MPNGGSDCCLTCWFNSKNDGEPGYHGSKKEGKAHCTIRDLEIPYPASIYCANHPHHNNEKIVLPIGPVDIDAGGFPYRRKLWVNPPDSEEIRSKLLELLDNIKIKNEAEHGYRSYRSLDKAVIIHLTALKEKKAVAGLKRVINLGIENQRVVATAIEALLEITDGEAIDDVKHFINKGIEGSSLDDYDERNDDFAPVRYFLVRGLKFSQSETAKELLKIAANDPHSGVKAIAIEILDKMNEC